MSQPEQSREILAGPSVQFGTMMWGAVIAGFGVILIVSSLQEKNKLYALGGGVLMAASIPVFLLRKQTVIDPAASVWVRKSGILGMQCESGSLAEVAQLSVRQGLDSKGHKYWAVNLVDQTGKEIPWHLYTYLGEHGMNQDVTRLETALGLKASWSTDDA